MANVKSFTSTDGVEYGFSASSLQQGAIPARNVNLVSSMWSNKTQVVSANGVTSSNNVIVSPSPLSLKTYSESGIYCSGQSTNQLTFVCDTVPDSNLEVSILIIE